MTVLVKLPGKVLGPHKEFVTQFHEQLTKEQSDKHDGGEHNPAARVRNCFGDSNITKRTI